MVKMGMVAVVDNIIDVHGAVVDRLVVVARRWMRRHGTDERTGLSARRTSVFVLAGCEQNLERKREKRRLGRKSAFKGTASSAPHSLLYM